MRLPRKIVLGSILAISCSWPMQVLAQHTSADANLWACVNLATKPATPVTYNFTTSAQQCMADIGTLPGQPWSLKAEQAGVSCTKIGYVQQKGWTTGGDNCYGLNSGLMVLSYNQVSGSATGSVTTDWWTYLLYNNHMRLENPSAKFINACYTPATCSTTDLNWPWGGEPTKTIYIIFQPGAPPPTANDVALPTIDRDRDRKPPN